MAKQQKQKPQQGTQSAPPPKPAAVLAEPNFFETLGNKAIWLSMLVIGLMAFIVYKDFILYKKAFLFKDIGSDTLNYYYPYFYLQADYFHKHGLPSWSFQYGMGQSTVLFSLGDLSNLISFIFSTKNYIYIIIVREMVKLICTGFVFYKFLKLLNLSNTTSLFGSLIICFSSYMVLGGCWYVFSYDLFCLAFLLFSTESALTKDKFFALPVAYFFIAISQPFNLFLFSLFLFGYLILRFTFLEKRILAKDFYIFLAKLGAFAIIGLMLACPFFLENFFQMLDSPRGSGDASYANTLKQFPIFGTADKWQLGTNIMRLFSSDMLGTGNNFKGTNYNYLEAPMFYCGLPSLLLVPQVFGFLNKNAKRAFAVVLAFWLLPSIFPFFRYSLWLYVGDYYRAYSLIVSITLMIFAIYSLDLILKRRKINATVLIGTLVGLFILMAPNYFKDKDAINGTISMMVKTLLLGYSALLWFIPKVNKPSNLIYAFFGLLVIELTYFSSVTVSDRSVVTSNELKQKVGYNDYTNEAVSYLKQFDKSPFYRIDKAYFSSPAMHGSLNDAMLQDYYGTSCYSSFNQINYINYLHENGVINKTNEFDTRWPKGLVSEAILQSLNAVKYLLVKDFTNPSLRATHDSIAQFDNIKLLRHKFILPMGYGYKSILRKSSFLKASNYQKRFLLLKSCYVEDDQYEKIKDLVAFDVKDTVQPGMSEWSLYRSGIDSLKKDTLAITKFAETHIEGTFNASTSELLYLSIPLDKGWHVKVDGNDEKLIKTNGGMSGIILNKGQHKIVMDYKLPYFFTGVKIALVALTIYFLLFLFRNKLFKHA